MTETNSSVCPVCGGAGSLHCGGCLLVSYCGKDHQRQHWKEHKSKCLPYKIMRDDCLGRYLEASRNILQGEIIIKEPALIFGPKKVSPVLCLGCHQRTDGSIKCSSCKLPMCGSTCEKASIHQPECKAFSKVKKPLSITQDKETTPMLQFVVPLRCLNFKETDPKKWDTLMNMDSHIEEKRGTKLWEINQRNVVDLIRVYLEMKEEDEETIHKVCQILETNSFEIRTKTGKMRALYPIACLMAHDCRPNTKHSFDADNNIILRASVPIKKGENITATYTQTFWNTKTRRHHLRFAKCFWCQCSRCNDPTEFGSYLSAVKCVDCGGYTIPEKPLEDSSMWGCRTCPAKMTAEEVQDLNSQFLFDMNLVHRTDPEALEEMIMRYGKSLPSSCSHFVELKHALIQIYGNAPGYRFCELPMNLLKRKEMLCNELLTITEKLEPGSSRIRGFLFWEKYETVFERLRRTLVKRPNSLTEKDITTGVEMAEDCLESAESIFLEESDGSNDKELASRAPQLKLKLKEWLQNALAQKKG